MEQVIQLFGRLILSFLSIIAPVIIILLSMFRGGATKLTAQYENEKAKSEKNIKEQLRKMGEADKTDRIEIKEGLRELERIEKTAKKQLNYLNPKVQILQLFVPLILSFLCIAFALFFKQYDYFLQAFAALALIAFCRTLFVLWKLLGIIIEVKKTTDDDNKERDTQMISLLSALVKKDTQYFLKDVYISIDDKDIRDEPGEITMSSDKKQKLKVSIHNSEARMAKNVEIGFVFPLDFIIEKTDRYSLHTNGKSQVVRYEVGQLHGNTNFILGQLSITPLETGDYKIKTFIKAENIMSMYKDLNIKVTQKPLGEIIAELSKKQVGEV